MECKRHGGRIKTGENIVIKCHAGNGWTRPVKADVPTHVLGLSGENAIAWVGQDIPRLWKQLGSDDWE
jgi:hypothetical protein